MRAAAYARVSSQRQRDAQTIESQLRVLPAYIASQGWKLAGTYVDDGKSAKTGQLEKRDGFKKLCEDADARRFDVVVVFDLDRISRADTAERAAIYGRFQRAGVRIATPSAGVVDPGTFVGEVWLSLMGAAAAEFNRKHSERIKQGKLTAISRGRKPSGPTPYGWKYDKTGGWEIDEGQAKIVRWLYREAAKGTSCYRLSEMCNAKGISRPRSGAWQRTRVWQIVANASYRGIYTADKAKGLTIKVPPIVTEEQWHATQEALTHRRTYPSPRARHVSLCEGIAVCGTCGARIGITGAADRRYYVCMTKKAPGSGVYRCPNRMRYIHQIDALVWDLIREVVERPDLLSEAVSRRKRKADATDWQRELADYERRLTRLERAESDILARYRRGKITQASFDKELDASARERSLLQRNRDLAAAQVARSVRSLAARGEVLAAAEALRHRLDTTSPEERRTLVRAIVTGADGLVVTIGPGARVAVNGDLVRAIPAFAAGSSYGRSNNTVFQVVRRCA